MGGGEVKYTGLPVHDGPHLAEQVGGELALTHDVAMVQAAVVLGVGQQCGRDLHIDNPRSRDVLANVVVVGGSVCE